jgi:hypothetical protein
MMVPARMPALGRIPAPGLEQMPALEMEQTPALEQGLERYR